MSRVVWKFTLERATRNDVRMPADATVVMVAAQFEKPCIWLLVDPERELVIRRFGVAMTGQTFDESECRYVGSFMLQGGAFLGHVIEAINVTHGDRTAAPASAASGQQSGTAKP